LVQASFDQIRKIPGVVVQNVSIQNCNNPTFTSDGSNKLADTAPMPQACDKQGPTQCATGTGGAAKQPTPVKTAAGEGTTAAGGGAATSAGAIARAGGGVAGQSGAAGGGT